MLQDKSESKEATWEFMERRIDGVMEVGKFINSNKGMSEAVFTGLSSIAGIVRPSKFDDSDMLRRQEELRKEEAEKAPTNEATKGSESAK